MRFKKGDRVSFRYGHGRRGDDYEGVGVIKYVRGYDGGDLLLLEDHAGIGSGISVLAKDCQAPAWQQRGEANATD